MSFSLKFALIRTGYKGKEEKRRKLFKGKLFFDKGSCLLNKTPLCHCSFPSVKINLKIGAQAFINWTDTECPAAVGFVLIIDSGSRLCASDHPRGTQ